MWENVLFVILGVFFTYQPGRMPSAPGAKLQEVLCLLEVSIRPPPPPCRSGLLLQCGSNIRRDVSVRQE